MNSRNRAANRRGGVSSPAGGGICALSDTCGACPLINVPYAQQLSDKQLFIQRLFTDIADDDCILEPISGMEVPLHFRNKIASPFAPGRPAKGARKTGRQPKGGGKTQAPEILCGMYAAHSHRIVAVEECPVEHEVGRQVVKAVQQLMRRFGMAPYDEDAGTGFMRHVVVRVGHESGEVLVTLVTNGREFTGSKNFCRELVKRCPQVTTVVQNINLRDTNAIFGDDEKVLYGPGFILDTLCGLSFRISSHSFYQVNARQTEVLYLTAINMAREALSVQGPDRGETSLLDAYCGTGTIGLVAASLIPEVQVLGVDKVEQAIRDARMNAQHNGIENARFVAEDAGAFMRRLAAQGSVLDVLMMDPPRAGASEDFLQATLALKPECIVYISCNPETQARDARVLCDGGYRLTRIHPVDMFPHTSHVECVTLMTKANKTEGDA